MQRKKAKKDHPLPELGFADHLLYVGFAMICFVPVMISVLYRPAGAYFTQTDQISFDPYCEALIIPAVTIAVLMAMIGILFWRRRYPVFGNPNVCYGPPAWPREIYPICWKDLPNYRTARTYRKIATFIVIILICLLCFSLTLFYWAHNGVAYLLDDGRLQCYDIWGNEENTYSKHNVDIAEFSIETYPSKGHGTQYKIVMYLHMDDGNCYSFKWTDFRRDHADRSLWIKTMLSVKNSMDGKIMIRNAQTLEKFLRDRNINPEDAELLRQLFS